METAPAVPLLDVGMNPFLRVCCDCWMRIRRVQIFHGCQVGMFALPSCSWSCAPARAPASALAPSPVTPPCDVASLSLSCTPVPRVVSSCCFQQSAGARETKGEVERWCSSPSGDLLPDSEVGRVQKKVQCGDQDQEPGYKGKVR